MSESSLPPLTFALRLRIFVRLLCSLRRHDFRSARTFTMMAFPNDAPLTRMVKFIGWALRQMWCTIPDAMLPRGAPSAVLIPISRVRCATVKDMSA